ncbi:MAG: ABC transporter permease [Planctomycetota bacterium]
MSAVVETVIRPGRRPVVQMLAELVAARHLLWLLSWRDVTVRYRQSFLGTGWAVVRPLTTMVILTYVFGMALGVSERIDMPYPLFAVTGMVPWMFFHAMLLGLSTNLVRNSVLVTKVYFSRLALAQSGMASPMVDLAVSMLVVVGVMAWYGAGSLQGVLIAAAAMGTLTITVTALGVALSALLTWYRDMRQALPFVLQAWMFLSPVLYPIDPYGESLRAWSVWLNPVAGSIMAFRSGIAGEPVDWALWGSATAVSVVGLAVGLWVFSLLEEKMADVV